MLMYPTFDSKIHKRNFNIPYVLQRNNKTWNCTQVMHIHENKCIWDIFRLYSRDGEDVAQW